MKRFGVKMGALSAKIESAARTQNISETISKTIPMLQRCMKKMDAMGVSILSENFNQNSNNELITTIIGRCLYIRL